MGEMTKKPTVPAIRFKGFTDTWEQRKFSDFTFAAGERNKDDLDLEPFAITNNQGFIAQSEAHDDFGYMKDVDRKMYIVVKPNSFAYNPARINVGSLGYYEGAENVIVSSLYEVFQTAEYVDDKFLKHWFKTKAFQDWIERLQEGSVRLYFYYDKLCECIMSMPSVEEQRKIGAYLDKIDNLITLHQRKLDKLHKVKRSLLERMFPRNGANVPEIRFSGFTGAWEQRKFSELTEIRSASRVHKEEWKSSGVPFYRSSDVMAALNGTENEKAFISEELYEKLTAVSGKLEKGDVLVTGGGSVGKPYIVANNEPLYTKDADLLWIKNNEYLDPYFVYTFFFSQTFTDYLNSVSHVGTIAHYTITQLGETPITLPCVSEQQKIGDYFRNLDSLITLHQRKLDKLRQIKRSMLEKMFV